MKTNKISTALVRSKLQSAEHKKMFNNSLNSISAIIDGKIVNNKGKQVIGYGEIVKTQTLKKLSNRFKIHKRITLIKVTKKNIYSRIKNNLIKIN